MTEADPRRHSPAAERNAAVILRELRRVLPPSGRLLEIASGSGQHAALMAPALPHWRWQPTDGDPDLSASIAGWTRAAHAANVLAPLHLDVMTPWPIDGAWDAVYCANLLHIAPWPVCAALMAGAVRHLVPGGVLLLYGPFIESDRPTAPSNTAFDADLRARNPAWGLRPLDDVLDAARLAGLRLRERVAMPANNLLLVLARDGSA